MKKLLAIVIAAAICLSMSGCGLIFNIAKGVMEENAYTTVIEGDVETVPDIPEESTDENAEFSEAPEAEPSSDTEEPAADTEDEAVADLLDSLDFYSFDEGIHLMMEKGMEESQADGFTAYALSDTAMFAAIKEDAAVFSDAGLDINDYDLEDYAAIVQQGNGVEEPFTEDIVGNLSVTYTSNQNGTDFFYYATVKEGTDCFWVITFACYAEDQDLYLPQFQVWGASIVTD